MKKIFYFASIAALAFSSCTKDDTTGAVIDTVGGAKITAAVAADDTRTSLDENKKVRWEAGDMLGVYTVGGGLDNAAFVLDNSSHESAIGVFNSQSAELKADKNYIAVYPRFQEGLIEKGVAETKYPNPAGAKTPESWDEITSAKYEDVVVKIPATQKYRNGSFYTQTVPSVSSKFVVDANGEADVTMQPVVDYLAVDIQSVEPIYTLSLSLGNGQGKRYILNGEGKLSKYVYNGEYRYMLDLNPSGATVANNNMGDNAWVTIDVDEEAAKVMCHSANTYVFTIPANILRKGETAIAQLIINKGMDGLEKSVNFYGDAGNANSWQLNYAVSGDGYKNPTADATVKTYRKANADTPRTDDQVLPLENSFFWMNERDSNGAIETIVYNPANTFIIENEGDLLIYLTEYGNTGDALNGLEDYNNFGKVDALICNDHTFDFSVTNIQNLSDRLAKNSVEYTKYEPYYSAYLKGSFPTITGEYKNAFRGMEYNGQVPVITGIEKALASTAGIFGDISGKIENVKFSGVVAKSGAVKMEDNDGTQYNVKYNKKGVILGSIATGGKLDNVTVENAHGSAILGAGNVAAYNELTVADVDALDFIVADMDIEKDLEIANWSVVSGVATSVFGTLDATTNGKTAANEYDSHHVVTLPAGADYADLALYIGVANNTGVVANTFYANANQAVAYYIGQGAALASIDVDQDNLNVVSVMIDGKSYWTGDKFPFTSDFWSKSKLLPATYTKDSDKIGETAVKGWYKVQYAEHLATGADGSVALQNDIVLSTSTMPWTMVEVTGTIEGQGYKVSGISMEEYIVSNVDGIAPVKAGKINNVKIDGVSINVYTTSTNSVPSKIGGLALDTRFISNVTVKNINIAAYGINGYNYVEANYGSTPGFIGWLTATAVDPVIENSTVEGVNSNVIGVTGLVGMAVMETGAAVRNSSASNVQSVQTALTNWTEAANINAVKANVAGTAVGYVYNNSTRDSVTFTFEGVGTPVALFYAPKTVVASYGAGVTKNLNNAGAPYNYDYDTAGTNAFAWKNVQ